MTRGQSNNQWSGGIAAHPSQPQKIPSAKIRWKSSRLDSFLDQDGILHIDYLPNGQNVNAEYYSSLLVQLKDNFEGKNRRGKVTKGVLILHDNAPVHRALATQNWPTCASSVLIIPLFSGSDPVALPPVPWTGKTIERSPFFFRRNLCCRGDLDGRTTF